MTESLTLLNAHIPACLLGNVPILAPTEEGLVQVDLEIIDGIIRKILPSPALFDAKPATDLKKKLVFPHFMDLHTHLDKGHIWHRAPNHHGTFGHALITVREDSEKHWQAEDLYRRMEFGLKCSYAHGTAAIRTHLDSFGEQADISFDVWQQLQSEWSDRLILQAVSLVSLDYYQIPEGIALADKVAEVDGILGGVAYTHPDLDNQLDQVFRLAQERGLDLDFHADENNEVDSICLQKIAAAALRAKFTGKILCGHCCSLAVQPEAVVEKTLTLVKDANIHIVSLPSCNLFLQDRQASQTPLWRGITRVHELKASDIPVAFANDNCRDPFHGFGDHDMLDVFSMAVKICHLNTPYGDWCRSVTQTPADVMSLSHLGRLRVGLPADLIIFNGRYFSELLSRHQSDRLILKNGKPLSVTLPDYAELDDLVILD